VWLFEEVSEQAARASRLPSLLDGDLRVYRP
jgi:hypothetical protein